MDLSVVIPCHDGGARLPETLAALAAAERPPGGIELIVVDDGSDPPLAPPPGLPGNVPLHIVRQQPARGRAAACNRGIEAARGRVVLILDDDMTVEPAALAGHVAAHDSSAVPHAVIGRIDPDPRFFRGRFGGFLAEEERRRHERLARNAQAVPFTDCLTGHFSAPRAAFEHVGGYDESFTGYGLEDIELAFRLARAGVPVHYRADLVARHRNEHARFGVHCRRHLEVGAMAALFARRHADPEVRAFLRIDGMARRDQPSRFRRWMAAAHTLVRRTPAPLRPALLFAGRSAAAALAVAAPERARHAVFHIVRDMHYAAGIAGSGETSEPRGPS